LAYCCLFFFRAEDGIRARNVTGVQTCALPILLRSIIASSPDKDAIWKELSPAARGKHHTDKEVEKTDITHTPEQFWELVSDLREIGRASCRERVCIAEAAGGVTAQSDRQREQC